MGDRIRVALWAVGLTLIALLVVIAVGLMCAAAWLAVNGGDYLLAAGELLAAAVLIMVAFWTAYGAAVQWSDMFDG